jgi:hypothetical protein
MSSEYWVLLNIYRYADRTIDQRTVIPESALKWKYSLPNKAFTKVINYAINFIINE